MHFGRNIFDHALEIIVAGHRRRQLHAGDIGLQHALETRDLQIEIGHYRLAYQSAHDSLLKRIAPRRCLQITPGRVSWANKQSVRR